MVTTDKACHQRKILQSDWDQFELDTANNHRSIIGNKRQISSLVKKKKKKEKTLTKMGKNTTDINDKNKTMAMTMT